MVKPVRFGIIGLGKISARLANALNHVKEADLESVASRDPQRSAEFARTYRSNRFHNNYAELINDPQVDMVYIGLTNQLHFEMTKMCLEARKAVLCEKPLVTNRKQAEELVALSKKQETFLMEALWTRCMPAYQKARQWVAEGKIGQVKRIQADFSFRTPFDPAHRLYNQETLGGSLFDLGVYPFNLATGLLQEYPDSACGSALIAPNGVDEAAVFSLHFASGALADLACGFNVKTEAESIIYGTSGWLVLENCYGPTYCQRYAEDGRLVERFKDGVRDGFEHEIRHCAELFRQGRIESDWMPWRDTIACTTLFDQLMAQWNPT